MKRKLRKFGLDDKEVALYLACLNEGRTPTDISKQTGINRATVYHYLEKLKKRGLITTQVRGKRKLIVSIAPETALTILIEKDKEALAYKESFFADLVQDLQAFSRQKGNETNVNTYTGKEGIQAIIDKIINEKKDIFWIGSLEIVLDTLGEDQFFRKMTLRRLEQANTSYAITHRSFLQKKRFTDLIGKFRQIKTLDEVEQVPALLVAFDTTVVLASQEGNDLTIVEIQNSFMTTMFVTLFRALWNRLAD